MKKGLIASLALFIFASVLPLNVKADGIELQKCKATAYCLGGVTASGCEVREGICAGKKEWIGKTIGVYKRLPDDSVGDFIGYFECLDRGGTKAINNGHVIDIWKKDSNACQEFMDLVYEDGCQGNIYILVID